MDDSPLIQTLRLIPPNRLTAFQEYLDFATPHPDYRSLCAYVLQYRPDFSNNRLRRDLVATTLFGNNPNRLKDAMAQVKKIADQYLLLLKVRMPKNNLSIAGQTLLLETLGLNHHLFKRSAGRTLAQVEKKKGKSASDYYHVYQCHIQQFYHHETEKYTVGVPALERANANLDLFFLISKLRILVDLEHRRKIHPEVMPFEKKYLLRLAKDYRYCPPVESYLTLIQLLEKPTLESFKNYFDLYRRLFSDLDKTDRKIIIHKLIHIGNSIYEQGELDILPAIFALYETAWQEDLLSHYQQISPVGYVNVVSIGYKLGEWEKTLEFIEQYFPLLPLDKQEENAILCEAYYLYYNKRFGEALAKIQALSSGEHFTNNLRRRVLKIWICYELSGPLPDADSDMLQAALTNLHSFLSRHPEWNDAKKAVFRDFERLTRKLLVRRFRKGKPGHKEKSLMLRTEIRNTKRLISRAWLLDKVNELLGAGRDN